MMDQIFPSDERFAFAYRDQTIRLVVLRLSEAYAKVAPAKVGLDDLLQESWLVVLSACQTIDPREDPKRFLAYIRAAIPNHHRDSIVIPFSTQKRDTDAEVPLLEIEETSVGFLSGSDPESVTAAVEIARKLTEKAFSSANPGLIATFVAITRQQQKPVGMPKSTHAKYVKQIRSWAVELLAA